MRKRRRILYQICGIFLGTCCMLSACHEKEETFTSVAAAEADAGDKKNETESKAAEEKPDKAKADPGGEEKEGSIWVYVCGEVASPGVYELQEGDRITHAIEAAGGLTEAAGQVYLNQAAHLTDGQRIYVPSKEEEQTLKEEGSPSDMADAGMGKDTGIINLNTATKAELLSLSGIGESRAEAIIAYRETNGGFRKIEDLKKVDGIKEGIFQKIREQITVE
ncbi:helix-hairpin-helix domain-containing protein [Coprococcus comes]|nr:helix-hairpin-helix domain-containing protein [Coprococcus comes]